MASDNKEEEFFLKSLNVERVFEIMERTDYFFIYNIRLCMEHSEIDGGVYLSELAEQMDMSVTDASKAVKNMEDKGYVAWKLDEKKERIQLSMKTGTNQVRKPSGSSGSKSKQGKGGKSREKRKKSEDGELNLSGLRNFMQNR